MITPCEAETGGLKLRAATLVKARTLPEASVPHTRPGYIGLIEHRLRTVKAGSAPGLRSEVAHMLAAARSLVSPGRVFDDEVERLLSECALLRDSLLEGRGGRAERAAALATLAGIETLLAEPHYPVEMDRLAKRLG